jgi:hypothetical protein
MTTRKREEDDATIQARIAKRKGKILLKDNTPQMLYCYADEVYDRMKAQGLRHTPTESWSEICHATADQMDAIHEGLKAVGEPCRMIYLPIPREVSDRMTGAKSKGGQRGGMRVMPSKYINLAACQLWFRPVLILPHNTANTLLHVATSEPGKYMKDIDCSPYACFDKKRTDMFLTHIERNDVTDWPEVDSDAFGHHVSAMDKKWRGRKFTEMVAPRLHCRVIDTMTLEERKGIQWLKGAGLLIGPWITANSDAILYADRVVCEQFRWVHTYPDVEAGMDPDQYKPREQSERIHVTVHHLGSNGFVFGNNASGHDYENAAMAMG